MIKRFAIILSFSIACIAVCLVARPALASRAASSSNQAATKTHAKKSAHKASLKNVSTHRRRRRRRYYHRRYRYRGPMRPSKERVSEIQSALARSGYYKGDPDGRWDAKTIDAMRNFQEDHGLDGTGKIDALSLQKLGLGSEIAGVDAPRPLPPQGVLPAGQSAPAVPGAVAKPGTPQSPQAPKVPTTGSGTGTSPVPTPTDSATSSGQTSPFRVQ